MWRRESQLSLAAHEELEGLEAALRGETVSAEHAELAELVTTLQEVRPCPTAAFGATLDERAAEGFASSSGRSSARSTVRRQRGSARAARAMLRNLRAHPAIAAAPVIVLVAAAALPVALHSHGGRAALFSEHVRNIPEASKAFKAPLRVKAPRHASQSAAASDVLQTASLNGAAAAVGEARREIERAASLDVGVSPQAIESDAQRVFSIADSYGGYVRQSNVSSGPATGGGATFELRIPSARLSGATAALAHLGHVRSENDSTNDVTERDASLSHSLGELRAERASVLAQLGRASDAEQAAILRARVRMLDARIASVQSAQRSLRARVDFTNLALSLTPEAAGATHRGSLTPGSAARSAAKVLETALAVLLLVGAAVLPLAALVALVWLAMSATRRRLREQALDAP